MIRSPLTTGAPLPSIGVSMISFPLGAEAGMLTFGCLPYGPDTSTRPSSPPLQAASTTEDVASTNASGRASSGIAVLRRGSGNNWALTLSGSHRPNAPGNPQPLSYRGHGTFTCP